MCIFVGLLVPVFAFIKIKIKGLLEHRLYVYGTRSLPYSICKQEQQACFCLPGPAGSSLNLYIAKTVKAKGSCYFKVVGILNIKKKPCIIHNIKGWAGSFVFGKAY